MLQKLRSILRLAILALLSSSAPPFGLATDLASLPWDLAELRRTPNYTTRPEGHTTQSVFYEVLPGRWAFGYLSRPPGPGPFPAVFCISGMYGAADRNWSEAHANRGYVAFVLNNTAIGPGGTPIANAILAATRYNCFDALTQGVHACATYSSVAACVRAISLLASLPEVDPARIGVTGLSWGGVLCSILVGLDDRLACAIPVYGTGYVSYLGGFVSSVVALPPDAQRLWRQLFEPARYLPQAQCPILFINGTNDPWFTPDATRQSATLVPTATALCLRGDIPHGPVYAWPWWRDSEVFLDAHLKHDAPYPRIAEIAADPGFACARFEHVQTPFQTFLYWTTDSGYYTNRLWQSTNAVVVGNSFTARLPDHTTAYYLAVEDQGRRAFVSTPPQIPSPHPRPNLSLHRDPVALSNWIVRLDTPIPLECEIQYASELPAWQPIAILPALDLQAHLPLPPGRVSPPDRAFFRAVLLP